MPDPLHVDDAQLRAMLALLSHDLRNPLAAVLTNLEVSRRVLAKTQGHEDLDEAIQDSVAACELVRRMLANLDLLAKGAGVRVVPQEVDVVALTRDAVQRNHKHAAQADETLAFSSQHATARAVIDKDLFGLALDNLLANAIQHAPRGSEIAVSVAQPGAAVEVSVHDAGPVIAEDHRALAVSPEGHTSKGRVPEARYSRGLGLLASEAAARASGMTLTLGGDDEGHSCMTLTIISA
jgi:signal transduction histidine kinase